MSHVHDMNPALQPADASPLPNNELFRASLERAPVGFTILLAVRDRDGAIVDFEWKYANLAALRNLNASGETLLGRRLLERLPGHRDHPQLFPRYVRTVETGEASQVEHDYSSEGIDGVFTNAASLLGDDLIGVWFEEITEKVQREQLLRSQLAEIEAIYQHAPVGLALFDPMLRFLRINDTLAEINGLPPEAHIGRWVWDIVPALRETAEPKLQEVLTTGGTLEAEICGETPKAPGQIRWWHEKYYPLVGKDGSVSAIGAVVEEITQRKAAENVLKLSAMELRHRIKNLISVVNCLAHQTFSGDDLAERRRDFEGRLRALDQANSVLGDEAALWSSDIGSLVLKTFEGKITPDRFTMAGPAVEVPPRIATALSMTLHELATNAMKYGALQTAEGQVELNWSFDQTLRELVMQWHEVGGPRVQPPTKAGFGSRLIQQMLAAEGGSVTLEYPPEGIRCTMRIEIRRVHDSKERNRMPVATVD